MARFGFVAAVKASLRVSCVFAPRGGVQMAQEQVEQPPRFMTGAVTTRLTVTVPAGISGGDLVRVRVASSNAKQYRVRGFAGHLCVLDSVASTPCGLV